MTNTAMPAHQKGNGKNILITERYYPMVWAFDHLGKHLYALQWTGNELSAREMDSPECINAKRKPLDDEIERIDKEVASLQDKKRRTTNEERLIDLDAQIQRLLTQRYKASAKLFDIREIDDGYLKAFETFKRRKEAETLLIDALKGGELSAQLIDGYCIPRSFWNETRGFQYYLEESLAVIPGDQYGKRRGTIVLEKSAFKDWLRGVVPFEIDQESPPSAEALLTCPHG